MKFGFGAWQEVVLDCHTGDHKAAQFSETLLIHLSRASCQTFAEARHHFLRSVPWMQRSVSFHVFSGLHNPG